MSRKRKKDWSHLLYGPTVLAQRRELRNKYYRAWRDACEARQSNDENPPQDVQEYHRFRISINERIDMLWSRYESVSCKKFSQRILRTSKGKG